MSLKCVLFALQIAVAASSAGPSDSLSRKIRELEGAVASNTGDASSLRELAHTYALALLPADGSAGKYAAAALDTSNNVWVLGNAAYSLQCFYNETRQRGSPNKRAAMLAERYFLRARSLDPKLDRQAILPQLDLQQLARANEARAQEQQQRARLFEEAAKRIRRLKPEAFPDLPPVIASVLRARRCTVPQPGGATTPCNAIRGEFFKSGQESWAVLCSVNGWSTILVFRTAQDAAPHSLAKKEDRNTLQGYDEHSVYYSREIQTAERELLTTVSMTFF